MLWTKVPKRRFDILLDHLLLVPSYLYELDNMRYRWKHATSDLRELFHRAQDIEGSLKTWFKQSLHEELQNDEQGPLYQDMICEDDPIDYIGAYHLPPRIYKDWKFLEEISVFSAGMILTLSILRDVCVPPVPKSYNKQMVLHSPFVLSTIPLADKKWGSTSGPLSLIFPLKTIATLSPDPEQRMQAHNKLTRWDRGIGSGGSFEIPFVASGNLYELNELKGDESQEQT
jgi:hypothetical protein